MSSSFKAPCRTHEFSAARRTPPALRSGTQPRPPPATHIGERGIPQTPLLVAVPFTQESQFPQLSGARIVRIAAHPDALGMGYGSRAVELLTQYYQGDIELVDDR